MLRPTEEMRSLSDVN